MMHDAVKKAVGIDVANCATCANLGNDGDGYEYNGEWPVCNKHEQYFHLKSFPFKKEMKCWEPEFWCSTFAGMIKNGEHEELKVLSERFHEVVAALSECEEVENVDA